MKNFLFVLFLLTISLNANANGNFGIGLIIGSPTGISGKYLLSKKNAIDGALAWDLGNKKRLHIHGDYLWHKFDLFKDQGEPIDLFFGVGARLTSNNDTSLGIRGPVGLRYLFEDPVIEVFVELALVLDIVPDMDVEADVGLGGRYYF